jgi:hypothetical protein
MRLECPFSPLLFNILQNYYQEQSDMEKKGIYIRKEEVKLPPFANDTILYVKFLKIPP